MIMKGLFLSLSLSLLFLVFSNLSFVGFIPTSIVIDLPRLLGTHKSIQEAFADNNSQQTSDQSGSSTTDNSQISLPSTEQTGRSLNDNNPPITSSGSPKCPLEQHWDDTKKECISDSSQPLSLGQDDFPSTSQQSLNGQALSNNETAPLPQKTNESPSQQPPFLPSTSQEIGPSNESTSLSGEQKIQSGAQPNNVTTTTPPLPSANVTTPPLPSANVTTPPLPSANALTDEPVKADAGPDQTVKSGDRVILDGSKSIAPTDQEVRYKWDLLRSVGVDHDVIPSGSDTPKASFIAPTVQSKGVMTFQLDVRTATQRSRDTVDITILPAEPPKLIIITHVINTPGGSKKAADFTIHVTGDNPSPNSFKGSESGVSVILKPGTNYAVGETTIPSYKQTYMGACSGTADNSGTTKTCIFTNQYMAPAKQGKGGMVNNKPTIKTPNTNNTPKTVTNPQRPLQQQTMPLPTTSQIAQQCPTTNVETAILKFNKLLFMSGIMPITFVAPFHIVCGQVWFSSPGSSFKIMVAEYTIKGFVHAAFVPLTHTVDPKTGMTWYHAILPAIINGINPSTGKPDSVSHITNLFLTSNGIIDSIANNRPISLAANITFQ